MLYGTSPQVVSGLQGNAGGDQLLKEEKDLYFDLKLVGKMYLLWSGPEQPKAWEGFNYIKWNVIEDAAQIGW